MPSTSTQSSESSLVHYQDDGEEPGTSGLGASRSRPEPDTGEYDEDWYLDSDNSSDGQSRLSSGNRLVQYILIHGRRPPSSWYSSDTQSDSPKDKSQNANCVNAGSNRHNFHNRDTVSSDSYQSTVVYPDNLIGYYNVFAKPILGDDMSPWQQRLFLERHGINPYVDCVGYVGYSKSVRDNNEAPPNDNGDDLEAYYRERVAAWLQTVRAEVEMTSLPARISSSDTDVVTTSRKRRREEDNVQGHTAKRSKSEADVGHEERQTKRRFGKAVRRAKKLI